MARRYTKSRKDEILTYLDENAGDVALTSLQMAVPERTLREWKRLRNLTVAAANTAERLTAICRRFRRQLRIPE